MVTDVLAQEGALLMAHSAGAYDQIKSAIIEGALLPGAVTSEPDLARQLGVSRTPVHQAVVRLQDEKWLEVSSRRGVIIAPLDATQIREIYEVLVGLEGIAVQSLAVLAQREDIVAKLSQINDRCERSLANGDLIQWAEFDNDFHSLLLRSSNNSWLIRVGSLLEEHAHRARLQTVLLRPAPTESNRDHARILAAIEQQDPEAARTALETHRRKGIETLVPLLEALHPRLTSDGFVRLS